MAASNPRKLKALSLLSAGRSAKDVAEELGVSDRTIQRWAKDCPSLSIFVAENERDCVSEALSRIRKKALVLVEKQLDKAIDECDELSVSRPIPVLPIACKISGLENPELLVETQLDELEKLLPSEHYASLLQALESLNQSREESTRTIRK